MKSTDQPTDDSPAPKSLHHDDIEFRRDTRHIRQYLEKSRFWRNLVLVLVALAPLASFTVYYRVAKDQVDQDFRDQLITVTRLIASTLDTGKLTALLSADSDKADYEELQTRLAEIRRQFPDIRQLATRVIGATGIYQVLDTDLTTLVPPSTAAIQTLLHTPYHLSDSERAGFRQLQDTGLWYSSDMVFIGRQAYQGACVLLPHSVHSDPVMLCSVFSAEAYLKHIGMLERDSVLAILFTIIASSFLFYSLLKNHQQVSKSLVLVEKQRDMFLEYSRTDPLTGALNRRAFKSAYAVAEAQLHRNKLPFALVTMDIDHFKSINDHYGHDQGDMVLRDLVQHLQQVIRPNDILMRMGGEEFAILCNLADQAQAYSMAEKLRETVSKIKVTAANGKTITFTISLGVHIINEDDDINTAQKHADVALYYAKASGRNRVVIYSAGLEGQLQHLQGNG